MSLRGLQCPNGHDDDFTVTGEFVTEYHDAAIPFSTQLRRGRVSNIRRKIEGSYYLFPDTLKVVCNHDRLEVDLSSLDEETVDALYEKLDGSSIVS